MNTGQLLLKSVAIRKSNDSITMIATARNFLSRDECQQVIMQAGKATKSNGTIGDSKEMSGMRDSRVTCLMPRPETMWLFDKLDAAVTHLNKAYQYDLLGFYEGVQVASYEAGGKYDWHMDLGPGENSTRKLSLSIQLSDSAEYEGGGLEFVNIDQQSERAIGTLIAFPSFMQHRVSPVTQGLRQSLVAWVHGQPFR